MKPETRAFIDELVRQKQYKKDNGPIELTADQLWKYSGEIEENTIEHDTYLKLQDEPALNAMDFARYYKRRIKEKNIYLLLSPGESAIIDCFYQNCNILTIPQMAAKLGKSKDFIKKVIEKHLKIQQDDKKNTSGRFKGDHKSDG
jgi:hypothetical protein